MELAEALLLASAVNPPTLRLFLNKKPQPEQPKQPQSSGRCPFFSSPASSPVPPSCSREGKAIHRFVRCDGCGQAPIVGKRFKCEKCPDYDLCEKCKDSDLHSFHSFTCFTSPVHRPFHRGGRHHGFSGGRGAGGGCPWKQQHCQKQENTPSPSCSTPSPSCESPSPVINKDDTNTCHNNAVDINERGIHYGVECDGCKQYPLQGNRYKCETCADYDICEICKDKGTHAEHKFTCIPQSEKQKIWRRCPRYDMVNQAPKNENQEVKIESPTETVKPEEIKKEEIKPEEIKPEEIKPEEIKTIEEKPQEKPQEIKELVKEEVKKEDIPIAPVQPEEKKINNQLYASQLAQLKVMGFDEDISLPVLEKLNGDILATVNVLLQEY